MAAKIDLASLDGLEQFASVRQLEYLEAIRKHKSIRLAGAALGVNYTAVVTSIQLLRGKAAMKQFEKPGGDVGTVKDTLYIKGTSDYYNKDGELAGKWVKTSVDETKRQEAIKAAYEAMACDIPRAKPIKMPGSLSQDLCNLYVMTDCHVGMLAWHKEAGEDWDLNIAETTLRGCFEQMVASAPAAKTAVIAQLGDWLHQDGILPVTPQSGHILDADGRFSKVVSASVRILRRMIDCALQRHEQVYVLMAEGNHDISSSIWLRVMFKALYENEPRVTMIDSEMPYYVHQHGETMLAFHHGHLKKNDQLPLLFAAQFPQVWGTTSKRYIHTGHRHHVEEKEHSGVTVVQHPTLAARDAYASRGGWISERQATATTYHAKRGKVGTVVVTPEMIEA